MISRLCKKPKQSLRERPKQFLYGFPPLTLRREVFQIHHSLHFLSRFKFSRTFRHSSQTESFRFRFFSSQACVPSCSSSAASAFGSVQSNRVQSGRLLLASIDSRTVWLPRKLTILSELSLAFVCRFSNKTIGVW